MFSGFLRALRDRLSRQRLVHDVREEIAFHLERDAAERMRRGASPDEAWRAARAELGGEAATREAVADVHSLAWIDDAARDLRHAARRLGRNPGYATLVVATIGLGVGAATAVFAAVDGVLLKPLAFPAPDALVTLWQTKPAVGLDRDDVAPRTFLDWTERTTSYAALGAANPSSVNHRGTDHTDNVEAWQVTEGFFRLFTATPLHGRLLMPEDFGVGSPPVAVLDHDFWQVKLGGDPGIIGTSLTLNERPHTVVGIMPKGFTMPEPAAAWLPWVPDSAQREDRFGTYIRVFGRLRAGVTPATAEAELSSIARRLEAEYPRSNTGVGARVIPLKVLLVGGRGALLWALLGASLLLLVVTVVNVSALHMTRLVRQRQETMVRAALGAARARLAMPLVAEALWLGVAGGLLGVGLAVLGVRVIQAVGPADLPRLNEVRVDARAMLFAVANTTSALVALVVIALTRLRESAHGPTSLATRSITSQRGTLRSRRLAVGSQLAVAFVLLSGTMLLVRSFVAVLDAERGFRTGGLLSFTTWVYGEYPTGEDRSRFVTLVMERIGTLPGVDAVSMASSLPLADAITGDRADVVIDGMAVTEGEEPQALGVVAWPNYHQTLGIPVLGGRGLAATDDGRGEPVVVVNEAFARRFSADREVVGRMVSVGLMGRSRPRRIVGVVGDTRHEKLEVAPSPAVYIPWGQQPLAALTFIVRTTGDAGPLGPTLQRAMFELDPRVGVARVATLDQLVDTQLRERRFLLLLVAGFAVVAVALACVGVAGVMAQSVVERRKEIGVRMALGASSGVIQAELLREAARMATWGLTCGGVMAVALGGAIRGFLYEVGASDPLGYAAATILLMGMTLVAAILPCRRATEADPARVLQD